MPWSGGNFSQVVGPSPIFTGPTVWAQDAAAGILIESERHDYHDQDLADGIDACLNKNGANSPTANINWGGFKTTNHGAGSATSDVAIYGQTITALGFNPGTNVLTLTRVQGGNLTIDLSALAVGGSTSDFARYSNGANPFTGSATFEGTLGALYTLQLVDTLTVTGTYTWAFGAATPTLAQIANTAGAAFNFSGNAGSAALTINGDAVWTTASLPASTFTGVLREDSNATITGNWAFTQSQVFANGTTWGSATSGQQWFQQQPTGALIQWNGSAGNSAFSFLGNTATSGLGDILVNGNRVWHQANMIVLASLAPTGGNANDIAFVQTGANAGVWSNIAGTWTKIAS